MKKYIEFLCKNFKGKKKKKNENKMKKLKKKKKGRISNIKVS